MDKLSKFYQQTNKDGSTIGTFNIKKDNISKLLNMDIGRYWFATIKLKQVLSYWDGKDYSYIDYKNSQIIMRTHNHIGNIYTGETEIVLSKLCEHLEDLVEKAEFGSISDQKTICDEKIRKGKSIKIDGKTVDIPDEFKKRIEKIFFEETHLPSCNIVPYKINIYETGDFFVLHKDSPEENLIATIVVNLQGPTSEFYIDGKQWDKKYNICIFYADVEHEVKSVTAYRETLIFKVYKNSTLTIPPELANENKELLEKLQSINFEKNVGFILQNQYTQENIDNFSLKGVDKKIYDALSLIRKIRFIPVIMKDKFFIDEICFENKKDFESVEIKPRDTQDYLGDIKVMQVNDSIIELLDLKKYDIKVDKIYCLDKKSLKISDKMKMHAYIGNQYTGTLVSNYYLSIMIIAENR